jgi:hypothetical protein
LSWHLRGDGVRVKKTLDAHDDRFLGKNSDAVEKNLLIGATQIRSLHRNLANLTPAFKQLLTGQQLTA